MILQRENPVKRCAILIGNDKWGGDFLSGVRYDLDGIKSFLLSPFGGAWDKSEIFEFVQPICKANFLSLMQRLSNTNEYVFLYFGGHGELSRLGSPLFVLPGDDTITLDDLRRIFVNVPTLVISDSCQGIPEHKEGGVLNESIKQFSVTDSVKEFKARRLFDKEIRKLPPMFTYASSVSPGQYAQEKDDGGLYTQELLRACKNIIETPTEEQGVIGICYPHSLAAQVIITNSLNKQRPRIEGYNRTFQPPFLVKL